MRYLCVFGSGVVCAALAVAGCTGQPAAVRCATGIVCPAEMQCGAVQRVCLVDGCGNGAVEGDEQCDDGNIVDGDGCSAKCRFEACGDGLVNNNDEQCDDGSETAGCNIDCTLSACGDGKVNKKAGEECDDGADNADAHACTAHCKKNVCGDGLVGPVEECDTAGASATCNANCTTPRCGDGIVNAEYTVPGAPGHEQCDPPSELNGCSPDCRLQHCGNGHTDPPGEECDGGPDCSADCRLLKCGNGILDPDEECDDGNSRDDDVCLSSNTSPETACKIARCGDHQVWLGHEECDGGPSCSASCRFQVCGNGILDPDDECDDGNRIPGDGCSATCKREFCGDDIVNNRTEQCDPGPAGETATCNRDCTLRSCGDGKLNRAAGEQCDHGVGVNADSADCTADCQINVCGDGKRNTVGPLHREGCDDGNRNDRDDCTNACIAKLCGDGIVGPDEDCDLGASNSDTGACLSSCLLARCGDGRVWAGVEECDGTPDCSPTCRIQKCSNGVVDPGEQCDDGAGNNGPGRRCNARCQFNVCGDGDRAGSEQCDEGANGAPKDTAACDTDCSFAVCGDGHLNTAAGEVCDDGLNNGKPGDPCSLTCQTVSCGNAVIEQGEECDDGPGNGPDRRCTACKRNVCGDGHVLAGVEQCDDGVAGVPHDTSTCDDDCTAAVCGDGHLNTLAGEVCDHGSNNGHLGDTCDAFCHLVACGNGFVDPGEQCDPATGEPATDGPACDADCTAVVCGDGRLNAAAGEFCDDGASNGDPCAYNDRSCVRCNSTCTAVTQPGGPFCGDSVVSHGEACDQGLLRNGQPCAYGDLACLSGTDPVCNIDCSGFIIGPNGQFCGDGLVQLQFREQCDPGGGLARTDSATCDSDCSFAMCGDGHTNATAGEACDDGNTDACGTCSAACGAPVTAAAAAGAIVVSSAGGADVTDGDTVTLEDGVAGHAAVVFELDSDGEVAPGHAAIAFIDTASSAEFAAALRDAINAADALDVTATLGATVDGATTVQLVNDHRSAHGNQPIGRTGTIAARFAFHDLAAGAAGDCAAGIGCVSSDDCSSGVCNAAAGRCQ